MGRSAIRHCALVALATLLVTAAYAQTVDELVAKNIAAKGGLAKLQSITTIKQTSEMTMQGTAASIVIYGKRPNLVRQEISMAGQKVVNAFDGQTAWMINPMAGASTPMVIGGPQADEIRQQSSFDGPLIDYKARGYRVDLVGSQTLGSRMVEHLRVTDKSGKVQDVYLDAETGLETRITTTAEGGAALAQELSDYRDVNGVKVPFSIRLLVNGVLQTQITVSKVEFNVAIDDSVFKAPAPGR